MSKRERDWRSRIEVAATLLFSALLTLFLFASLAMGECLPHHDAAAVDACYAGKRFGLVAFPPLAIATLAGVLYAARNRGRPAPLLVLGAPLAAYVAVLLMLRISYPG